MDVFSRQFWYFGGINVVCFTNRGHLDSFNDDQSTSILFRVTSRLYSIVFIIFDQIASEISLLIDFDVLNALMLFILWMDYVWAILAVIEAFWLQSSRCNIWCPLFCRISVESILLANHVHCNNLIGMIHFVEIDNGWIASIASDLKMLSLFFLYESHLLSLFCTIFNCV